MLVISDEQKEFMGKAAFIERIATMLLECEAVAPDTGYDLLYRKVAEALDEADDHGITTERLMGMYVILRLADKVDPYSIPAYAAVLANPDLAEAEKAHLLQMIRLDALK